MVPAVAAELPEVPDEEVPEAPVEVPELPEDARAPPVDVAAAECAGSSWATTPTKTPVPTTADAMTQRLVRRTRWTASSRWLVSYR